MAITMSGILAETGYNLMQNIQKLIVSKKETNNTKESNAKSQENKANKYYD